METSRHRGFAWLLSFSAFLIALLLIFPYLYSNKGKTISLLSITTKRLIKIKPNDPDIQVDARFIYKQSLVETYIKPNYGVSYTNAYIADAKNSKHFTMMVAPNSYQSIAPRVFSRDQAVYLLWLNDLPRSSGKLTFHFTASSQDGSRLPISTMVRN